MVVVQGQVILFVRRNIIHHSIGIRKFASVNGVVVKFHEVVDVVEEAVLCFLSYRSIVQAHSLLSLTLNSAAWKSAVVVGEERQEGMQVRLGRT